MLQKEVVARMAAKPGGKEYGRLTVMLAPWVRVEPLFDIGTGAFSPPPKVISTFFALHPHATPPFAIHDHAVFAKVVLAAFGQRRKTLRNSLAGLLDAAADRRCRRRPGCPSGNPCAGAVRRAGGPGPGLRITRIGGLRRRDL